MIKSLLIIFSLFVFLERTHALPKFKVFDSRSSAIEYHREHYALLKRVQLARPIVYASDNDSRYVLLDKIVAKVHRAFLDVFPDSIQYSYPPRALITIDEKENAHVFGEISNQEIAPYYFHFSSSLFKFSEETITSIIAHELVHLHLQWSNSEGDYPNSFYYKKGPAIQFGHEAKSSEDLKELMERREILLTGAGPFSHKELQGIPFEIVTSNISHFRNLVYIFEQKLQGPNTNLFCIKTAQTYADYITNIFLANYSEKTETLHLKTEEIKNKALNDSYHLEQELRNCLKGERYSYVELLRKNYHIPEDILEYQLGKLNPAAQLLLEETKSYYDNHDTVDAILLITKKYREKLASLEREIDLSQIRKYTHEDHADEMALAVLIQMGIPPTHLNQYITRNQRQACPTNATVQREFGSLSNSHHDPCWRAHRNDLFYKKYARD